MDASDGIYLADQHTIITFYCSSFVGAKSVPNYSNYTVTSVITSCCAVNVARRGYFRQIVLETME